MKRTHLKLFGVALCAAVLAACGNPDVVKSEAETIAQGLPEDVMEEVRSSRTPVEIKTANCLLWPSNFRGDCQFEPRGRGSFSVRLDEGDTFYDDVAELLVTVYMPGQADVRAMNADGTSHMIGEAKRSETYPACWIGTGFSVCAY